ncbi:prepilin peptidase [Yersinia enterocolitica]
MNDFYIISTQFPLLWWTIIVILGLCAGSFLNVVIYRLPMMIMQVSDNKFTLWLPRSHCPQCKTPILAYDNIPVISWLLLRGRCRTCSQPIPRRYPQIELLTLLATVIIAALFTENNLLLAALIFTWVLIALSIIDIDHQLLPDNLTLSLLWGGLLFHINSEKLPLNDAVVGAIVGYLTFWLIYWLFRLTTGKEGLGYGDFKLLAALGAWLGWEALPHVVLGASVLGIVYIILRHGMRGSILNKPFPFGPFLSLSGWLVFILNFSN